MSRGFPSMTALLGLLAIAGYQNRDKLAEMLGGKAGRSRPDRLGRVARATERRPGGRRRRRPAKRRAWRTC